VPRTLQAKSDATQQLEQKAELEKEKKRMQELAQEKEKLVDRKLKTIGNYVHDSVPESDNEVWAFAKKLNVCTDGCKRTTMLKYGHGRLKVSRWRRRTVFHTTKFSRA
jgi:seryl-tRNA synthetase